MSVNAMVEAVLEMLNYQLRTSNIEVVTQLDPALPVVLADGHQIQQVLLNVVNNARQAMENQQSGGRIIITTETSGENVPRGSSRQWSRHFTGKPAPDF